MQVRVAGLVVHPLEGFLVELVHEVPRGRWRSLGVGPPAVLEQGPAGVDAGLRLRRPRLVDDLDVPLRFQLYVGLHMLSTTNIFTNTRYYEV